MRRDTVMLLAMFAALVAYFAVFGRFIASDDEAQQARHTQAMATRPFGPAAGGLYITIAPQPSLRAGMQSQGTAFSLDGDRLWLTARHVVEPCLGGARYQGRIGSSPIRQILVSQAHDAALVTTGPAGAVALGLSYAALGRAKDNAGYLVGYPGQSRSLVSGSLIGEGTARQGYRGGVESPVSVYAEVDRIPAGYYGLSGMSGGPMINPEGNVIGVLSAEMPRRGRVVIGRVDDWMANKTRPPKQARTFDGSIDQVWSKAGRSIDDGSIAEIYCSLS
jgi:serine protease Do